MTSTVTFDPIRKSHLLVGWIMQKPNNRMKQILYSLFLSTIIVTAAYSQLARSLPQGPHAVGFRIIDSRDQSGSPIRLCMWYPSASQKGIPMKLSDYIQIPLLGGPQDSTTLRNDLKRVLELPFVMGLSQIPQKDFDQAMTTTTLAMKDAPIAKGKWPLIISDTEPSMLLVTHEYLASNGFIIAVPAMQYPNSDDAKTRFEGPTRGLESVLQYMLQEPYVDTSNVSALGFGGGSVAAFLACMRTPKITSLVNIEGGLFMPETEITLSSDYQPDQFQIPLLHVVNPYILSKELVTEFNAVKSKRYRLMERKRLRHHDFTIYGKIANDLLHLRGEGSDDAIKAYQELHTLMLSFLRHRRLAEDTMGDSPFFTLEIF
jgi:hypothetical protein